MEEEQRIASEVRSRLTPAMRRSIPAPLGTFAWGQVLVGIETYAGRPISNHAADRTRRRIEDLLLVTQWLEEFHRQSQVGRGPFSASQMQMYVERPLADYAAAFGSNPKEETLFEQVRDRARSLLGSPFPVVYSHGGFSEFNICRSGKDIRVIDWEGVGIGPPLVDLIYFVTVWYYRSGQRETDRVDSFEALFFSPGDDPLASQASTALDRYMKSLSIDRGFFPVMLVLTWVIRALGQIKRNRAFGEPQKDPRKSNHVAFLRILAENQDRLFAENKS
jgi:aminoglycoside phosphotransferase (APT) family kinase protein